MPPDPAIAEHYGAPQFALVRTSGRRSPDHRFRLHLWDAGRETTGATVFSFSVLLSLALVAIADIHRPFQGLIHVRVHAFQRALQSMKDD